MLNRLVGALVGQINNTTLTLIVIVATALALVRAIFVFCNGIFRCVLNELGLLSLCRVIPAGMDVSVKLVYLIVLASI